MKNFNFSTLKKGHISEERMQLKLEKSVNERGAHSKFCGTCKGKKERSVLR